MKCAVRHWYGFAVRLDHMSVVVVKKSVVFRGLSLCLHVIYSSGMTLTYSVSSVQGFDCGFGHCVEKQHIFNYELCYWLDNFRVQFYALEHCFDQWSLPDFSRPTWHSGSCVFNHAIVIHDWWLLKCRDWFVVLPHVVATVARHVLHNTLLSIFLSKPKICPDNLCTVPLWH